MGVKNKVPPVYYRLKKDEDQNSQTFGRLLFYPQVRKDNKWVDGTGSNFAEGYLKDIEIQTYLHQGKPIQNLKFELIDNENPDATIFFQIGLRSFTAQGIINTLAGEDKFGVLTFECGKPRNANGKLYPTLWIKNDGQRTKWRYCTANQNLTEIPKAVKSIDGNGKDIWVGMEKVDQFWIDVLGNFVAHKLPGSKLETEASTSETPTVPDPTSEQGTETSDAGVHLGPSDDLPF